MDRHDNPRIVEVRTFKDFRGQLTEAFHEERDLGIGEIKQTLCSMSKSNVVRGLHYQWPNPMGKLVMCVSGQIIDVVLDIRRGSNTFGQSSAWALGPYQREALWVPQGFAHGFMALTNNAVVLYFCDQVFDPQCDRAINAFDPSLSIAWPPATGSAEAKHIQSDKDADAPMLKDVPERHLPGLV